MSQPNPKIYLLPNLMTAGNLFCGFAAVLCIYDGAQETNYAVRGDEVSRRDLVHSRARAFSICSMAASRASADMTAHLAASSIRSRTWFRSGWRRRCSFIRSCWGNSKTSAG